MKLDNYELLDIIGEGGFGLVYRAKQLSTDQIVAIKVLKFDETTPEEKKQHQIARFERETQLGAKLNHPHIVKLLDKGTTEDNRLYAVFEHVEGQTLKDMIIEQNGLSAVETGELMGQILDGLAAAHAQGIVHRDLKPTNIMVTKTGLKSHAKILDFGIGAFTASFQPKDYAMLTLTKETLGTPAYSAPEQLRGEPPTTKSDLYAWGLILLECLIGSPVMRGESVGEVFEQQLSANQVPLPSAIAEHPLGKLLRNVLEKNPIHRSADAQRIAEEFTRINFQTLVGQIQMPQRVITDADVTSVTDLGYTTSRSEKRQITVLSIQLSLAVTEDAELDEEVLDTLQEDQMALTTELATRYGGYLAGSVADTITVYFGYPQKSENDARFAGRTALELISQAQKRSALMLQQHGVELDVRMGMHSGTVLLKKNAVPKGNIPNTAFSLLNRADSDQVLVSETTKTLLDPFLEFDEAGEKKLSKHGKPEMTYFLQGERQSEALSFLRPWSANRAMIGRDSEMKLVLDTWRKLDMGHGQALLVRGQAGIGKSKLIHEAKRQIGNEGANVKEVRCFPEHRNNALYPFFEMLKKYLGMLDLDETSSKIQRIREFLTDLEADIDTLLPIFCSWLSIPLDDTVTGSQLPPDQQKTMLMEAMLKLLQHLGADSKYLLVVEDLHWMDPTSQELVQSLLENLKDSNLLVLQTARPEFHPEWEFHGLQILELQPLDQDRTRRMIQGVLDSPSVDEKLVKYVSERADGIPLFIEELTHMLLDREFLILKDDTYQLDETRDMTSIPVRLNDLLNARLDKLGFAKETAQLAATVGREFDYNVLVGASIRDEASVQADLQALAQADMIYHQRRVQGDSYIFRHALIRDAAYDGMSKKEQIEGHRRIAHTLETLFPAQVNEFPLVVARHHEGCENFPRAIQLGIIALKKLALSASNKEAIAVAEKVRSLLEKVDYSEERLQAELEVDGTVFPAVMTVEGYGAAPLLALSENIKSTVAQLNDFNRDQILGKLKSATGSAAVGNAVAAIGATQDQMIQVLNSLASKANSKKKDEDKVDIAALAESIQVFQTFLSPTLLQQVLNAEEKFPELEDEFESLQDLVEERKSQVEDTLQPAWEQEAANTQNEKVKELLQEWEQVEKDKLAPELRQQLDITDWITFLGYHYGGLAELAANFGEDTLAAAQATYADALKDENEDLAFATRVRMIALMSQLAQRQFFNSNTERGIELWEKSNELYQQETDIEPMRGYGLDARLQFLVMASMPYQSRGQIFTARKMLHDAIDYSDVLGDPGSVAFAYFFYALHYYWLDDKQEVINKLNEYFGKIDKSNPAYHAQYGEMLLHSASGEPAKADAIIQHMIDIGQPLALSWYMHYNGLAYIQLGENAQEESEQKEWFKTAYEKMKAYLKVVQGIDEEAGYSFMMTTLAKTISKYPEGEEEPQEAIDSLLEEAISYAQKQGLTIFELEAKSFAFQQAKGTLSTPGSVGEERVSELQGELQALVDALIASPVAETDQGFFHLDVALELLKGA